jgi:hypothetical protein
MVITSAARHVLSRCSLFSRGSGNELQELTDSVYLYVYGLINDAAGISYCIASNGRVTAE